MKPLSPGGTSTPASSRILTTELGSGRPDRTGPLQPGGRAGQRHQALGAPRYSQTTGPSQSNICRFSGTGQGAPAWISSRRLDRSYDRRTASAAAAAGGSASEPCGRCPPGSARCPAVRPRVRNRAWQHDRVARVQERHRVVPGAAWYSGEQTQVHAVRARGDAVRPHQRQDGEADQVLWGDRWQDPRTPFGRPSCRRCSSSCCRPAGSPAVSRAGRRRGVVRRHPSGRPTASSSRT